MRKASCVCLCGQTMFDFVMTPLTLTGNLNGCIELTESYIRISDPIARTAISFFLVSLFFSFFFFLFTLSHSQ